MTAKGNKLTMILLCIIVLLLLANALVYLGDSRLGEAPEIEQTVLVGKFAFSISSDWKEEPSSSGLSKFLHKNGVVITFVREGEIGQDFASSSITLLREDAPLLLEDLMYGGELEWHVIEAQGERIIEGYIVRDHKHVLQFEARIQASSQDVEHEVWSILRTVRGVL